MFQIILTIATLALMIFALVEVITSENWQIQHLPKVLWILLILVLPLIGSVIWLVVGKDRGALGAGGSVTDLGSFGDPRRRETRSVQPVLDDDEAIDREIAFHEKQAEIRRLETELRRKRGDQPG